MQAHTRSFLLFLTGLATVLFLFLVALAATDPAGNLVLVSAEFAEGTSGRVVTGMVENRTARVFRRVRAQFDLLSDDGRLLGRTTARVDSVLAGQTWRFEVPVQAPGAVALRGTVASPDNRRPAWLGGCSTTC
jgi:hypothetical protein